MTTIINPNEQQLAKYKGFLRGGNTGYINAAGESISESNSSCFRMILLRHHAVSQPLDFRSTVTFAVGHSIENAYEDFYLKGKHNYKKELFLIEEITPAIACKLAVDFFINDSIPVELKSVSSTSSYEKVFVKGAPKFENVIQLVNYLISLELTSGSLVYINTIYHTHKGTKNSYKAGAGEIKKFSIDISDEGMVQINSQDTAVHINAVLDFRDKAAHIIEDDIVEPLRPFSDTFSPCNFCFFKKVCDRFDASNFSTNDFIEQCKQQVIEGE